MTPPALASSASSAIRRTHSAPRLRKAVLSPAPERSALVPSRLSTPDTSSGDEAVWIRPKRRGQFDCNICFDAAREPVVTQCGHLYCWQCLHQVTSPHCPTEGNLVSSSLMLCLKWLSSPSVSEDPTCPTCKSGCEMQSLIPIYGRGPGSPPRTRSPSPSPPPSVSNKKIPRALRFADLFLLPYMKSPSSTAHVLPPRPQAKQLPPRSILRNSPFYMLLQSAQQHYPFLPDGTVLTVPQRATARFGRPHLFMLVFAIWAALFKMMADSGRSWRTFSAFNAAAGTSPSMGAIYLSNTAEGDSVSRLGLILGMFLGFGLLLYRSRFQSHGIAGH
jgi:Zinc finger, C3HC4 type (RING finger)